MTPTHQSEQNRKSKHFGTKSIIIKTLKGLTPVELGFPHDMEGVVHLLKQALLIIVLPVVNKQAWLTVFVKP